MKGWISIHRQIRAHWIWENEKYLKAWIDLLLMMNHKDAKVLFRNELIEVKRGERITSQVKLSKRWNWSRGKVRKFLEMLENDDMIILKTDKRKTVINVVNYDTYQISDAPKSQQKANRKPRERHKQ